MMMECQAIDWCEENPPRNTHGTWVNLPIIISITMHCARLLRALTLLVDELEAEGTGTSGRRCRGPATRADWKSLHGI